MVLDIYESCCNVCVRINAGSHLNISSEAGLKTHAGIVKSFVLNRSTHDFNSSAKGTQNSERVLSPARNQSCGSCTHTVSHASSFFQSCISRDAAQARASISGVQDWGMFNRIRGSGKVNRATCGSRARDTH